MTMWEYISQNLSQRELEIFDRYCFLNQLFLREFRKKFCEEWGKLLIELQYQNPGKDVEQMLSEKWDCKVCDAVSYEMFDRSFRKAHSQAK